MNWFEEQVRARRENDRRALDDAYEAAVNSVIGESFSFDEAEDAITSILRYYHLQPVRLPEDITDENEKLSAVCRISGMMQRPVILDANWYRSAFGAFLCKLKNSEQFVAVIPNQMGFYAYYDREQRRHIKLNRKTAELLENEAVCFYKPLPPKKLTVAELVVFGISSWSISDHVFTYLMLGITTLLGLLTPRLSYFLYSKVVESGSVTLLLSTMIFMVTLSVSVLFLDGVKTLFSTRTSTKMSAALQSASMMRTLSLPPRFFRNYSSGEIISRMGYMESVCSSIVNMIFSTTLTSLFSLAYITQIFSYTAALVVPSLIVILANVLFTVYTTLRQRKFSKRQMELSAVNSGMGIEMISGIQKIKLAGAEKRMFARYAKHFSEESRVMYNPPFFNKYNTVISLFISLVGQLVIYYVTVGAHINVAQYYAFQTSYGMISAAISGLVSIALQLASLRPSLEMLQPMLDAVPENSENCAEITSLSGNIEMSNVCFHYEEAMPNVIDHFNLKVHPGEYVAIVGKTGCGKSTLIRLLLGFEKPQTGAIYYDGKDLNQIEKRSLRQKIGTVMQDDKLFTGDIYSNIVVCAPTLNMDAAWEAAEIAGIADDIRAMPMGMHTLISDGSGGISGGQRQRLTIARAIAPKPKILIFDEATSALDNITQKKISEALDHLDCTRIVIAHRLSTIRHCDRILVMDNGRITEEGTYDELIAMNGYFASLVERQRLDSSQN